MGGGEVDGNDASAHDVSGGSDGGNGVTINIRCSNGSKFSVEVKLESTVRSFKTVLAQKCDIPPDQQQLIYKGRILNNDQTLQSYGLEADHTVHLVRSFASSSANTGNSGPTGATNPTRNNTEPLVLNDGGSVGGFDFGASLLPGPGLGALRGLGGNDGLFRSSFPDFEQVQQHLTRTPNIMRDIMNLPIFQSLMNNPDIVRNMIMNNPQMRQIIDRNPELAHVLNDQSILRQTLEAARNPELMREMMRNTDRAMSNIEATPDGFNLLRRMYENVQEPLLNAATVAGNTGSDSSNPFAAILGAQTRDHSTNQSTTASENNINSPAPNTNPLPNPWTSTGTGGALTNTTRSNSDGFGRPQTPAAVGGVENMFGAMPDANLLSQLMQNPAITQMMQRLLSNPQTINEFQGILDSTPQLREMFQNPDFLRQMTSPETLQQLLSFQQSLLSLLGRQQPTQETAQAGVATGASNNMGLEMLLNMFGSLGDGNLAVPPTSNVPPEELYATQLSQLQEMGFFDTQENIRALIAAAGNVHAAVERLLGNPVTHLSRKVWVYHMNHESE